MRNQEYDSFGPWVFEISDSHPMPPVFIPHVTREEKTLFSIKIPRQIERRDAQPGTHLYDYVVNLYENDILILKREGDEVISYNYSYEKIECIQHHEHLLLGCLRLTVPDNIFDLPYNNVSVEIIQQIVDLIRQRYTDEPPSLTLTEQSEIQENKLSFYLKGLLVKEKIRNPGFKILATQGEASVGFFESGLLRKLQHSLLGKKIPETLHLTDGRELMVFSRGKPFEQGEKQSFFRRKSKHTYNKETFYVPLKKLTEITWEDEPENTAVLNQILRTSNNNYQLLFLKDNPSVNSYADFLKTVRKERTG